MGPTGTVMASAVAWAASSFVFVAVFHAVLKLPILVTARVAAPTAIAIVASIVMTRLATGWLPLPTSRAEALASTLALMLPVAVIYSAMMIALRVVSLSMLYGKLASLFAKGRAVRVCDRIAFDQRNPKNPLRMPSDERCHIRLDSAVGRPFEQLLITCLGLGSLDAPRFQ